MRFLPDIRYGTENYPEKVARRLRAFNLTAWSSAAIAASSFAIYVALEFLDQCSCRLPCTLPTSRGASGLW